MGSKITQYSLSLALSIIASVLILSLFFIFAVGIFAGILVEAFKFYSRISNRELKGYKISKPIEKDNVVRKTKKIFKLPLPDNIRSKEVVMSPMSEKKLSKVQ